jgi:hexosaminidase
MRSILGAFALPWLLVLPTSAQEPPALMPVPAEIEYQPGKLRLDSSFSVAAPGFVDDRLRSGIGRALLRIEDMIGRPLGKSLVAESRFTVQVAGPGDRVQSPDEDEAYTLEVSATAARLTAATTVGALRGLETLVQLVSGDEQGFYLPAVRIADRPRFRWRGLLVDAGRHFMPPEVIKRTLDGMAVVKLNVLHWHLSDDQGFRVESRRYPKLHQLGSDSLYYSRDQIREIVNYARDRGIRVVPEFDMPGHTTSWLVGYPEYGSAPGPYQIERKFGVFDAALDPTREATYQFIDGFVEEVAALFPDPFWHIGGDEVSPNYWNRNPRILRFKREHGLTDNEALQASFNQRLSRILTKHGKRMIGWDEILHETLPKGTVIQSWRGTEYLGRAARQGFSAILSAPYYLDHIAPADEHYLSDPLPPENGLSEEQAARVLGGEACMWAEHISAETIDSRLWPRLAAIAERFWSPASVRDVNDMYRRLSLVSIQLERVGLGHEAHSFRMLRLLTGRRGVQPLQDLLAVTMPVTFGQRGRLQGTTQLTPLTRLVDAARPDPWARSQMNRLAAEVARDPKAARPARQQLRRMFAGWKSLGEDIAALSDSLPLARDGVPAAQALGQLGAIGARSLDFLENGGMPARWRDSTRTALEELEKPQGLLRLAGVEAVRTLVEALP